MCFGGWDDGGMATKGTKGHKIGGRSFFEQARWGHVAGTKSAPVYQTGALGITRPTSEDDFPCR